MSRTRLVVLALLAGLAGGLVWLSRDQPANPMGAIGPEAAYVLCERVAVGDAMTPRDAWREHLPAPGGLGAPAQQGGKPGPIIPAALFSNDMSPHDLQELGYAEGRLACAAWLAPPAEALEPMGVTAFQIGDAMGELEELGKGCGCASARSLQLSSWLPSCRGVQVEDKCEASGRVEAKMHALHAQVLEGLHAQVMPRAHWRLAGEIGRTGRFAALHAGIAGHLGVGGVGYTPAGQHPEPGTDPLVEGLLGAEGVQAVMRSDGGRGITVVRELGSLLLVDYFEHAAAGPRWGTHYAEIDAGPKELPALLAALELPASSTGPAPKHPTQIFDYEMLLRLDGQLLALQGLDRDRYEYEAQNYAMQLPVFARLRFESVPEGGLDLLAVVSEPGHAFLTLGEGGSLVDRAGPLHSYRKPYVFEAGRRAPPFALRGTPLEQGWFDGPRSWGALVDALVSANPSAVEGTLRAFRMQLPAGPLPGNLPSISGLQRIRGQLSEAQHELQVQVKGDVMHAKLRVRAAE